jgi:hypothetical protein
MRSIKIALAILVFFPMAAHQGLLDPIVDIYRDPSCPKSINFPYLILFLVVFLNAPLVGMHFAAWIEAVRRSTGHEGSPRVASLLILGGSD